MGNSQGHDYIVMCRRELKTAGMALPKGVLITGPAGAVSVCENCFQCCSGQTNTSSASCLAFPHPTSCAHATAPPGTSCTLHPQHIHTHKGESWWAYIHQGDTRAATDFTWMSGAGLVPLREETRRSTSLNGSPGHAAALLQ